MLANLLYLSATACLLIGSALSFNSQDLASYFFLIGSSLFFLKSGICLFNEIKILRQTKTGYLPIN